MKQVFIINFYILHVTLTYLQADTDISEYFVFQESLMQQQILHAICMINFSWYYASTVLLLSRQAPCN